MSGEKEREKGGASGERVSERERKRVAKERGRV